MNCLLRDQHEQWKRHPEKRSRSVKIFRCQLPRFNPFYPSEPPRCDGTDKPSGTGDAIKRAEISKSKPYESYVNDCTYHDNAFQSELKSSSRLNHKKLVP
nr:hypothetical protein CFP56_36103 [Quercus suber]